jgi:hypothetical protein
MSALTRWMAPPAWAEQLDFVGPRVRTSPWAWLVLAAGLSLLAVQADEFAHAQGEQSLAQENLRRLERAQHQAKLVQQAREVASKRPASQEASLNADGYLHAAQLAQWLGFDWAGVWAKLESQASADKVVLTGFSLDLNTLGSREGVYPELQLHALVTDDATALQWVAHMGPGAQLKAREALPAALATSHGNYAHKVDVVMVQEVQP